MHANVYYAVVFRLILLNFFFQIIIATISPYTQILLRNKGYSHSLVGLIVAIGQLGSIILPLIISGIADRTRKTKLIFFILTIVCALAFFPAALSGSVVITALSLFVVSGMYLSTSPIIDGYQTRLLKGDAEKYGFARSAGTLSYVISLALFSLTHFPNESDNMSIAMCLVIFSAIFLLVVMIIPNDLPPEKNKEKRKYISGVFSNRFYVMMIIVGLTRMAHSVADRLLSSYLVEDLGLGGNFALFISLGALAEFVMMIVGGVLLKKKKTTPYTLIVISCIALIVRLLIYRLFPNIPGLVCAQLLHAMTFGGFHIAVTQFISHDVKKEHYSLAMSFYWAIASNLPGMLGALLGGFVIDSLGFKSLFLLYTLFPLAAVFLALYCRDMLRNKA